MWFALLIIAALFGVVMVGDARQASLSNDDEAEGATQQTVVALYEVADLATVVIYELIVVVVALASLGLFLISRDERRALEELDSPRGAHVSPARLEHPPG